MRDAEDSIVKKEINGCRVTLSFAAMPVEGVIERVQSILSGAYDERVQNDLIEIITSK